MGHNQNQNASIKKWCLDNLILLSLTKLHTLPPVINEVLVCHSLYILNSDHIGLCCCDNRKDNFILFKHTLYWFYLTRGDRESSLNDSFCWPSLNHLDWKFFNETLSVPSKLPTPGLRKNCFWKKFKSCELDAKQ